MKEFKDKVAVITGGANGIGRGLANTAVKEGMSVVLADIEVDALSKAESELKDLGANILSVITDVTKAEDVEKLAQRAIDTFGKVHLLCNNAGVILPGPMWDHSLSDWQWIINVNFWGVIHGIRNFVPIMLKQHNECHIVNTASLAGLMSGDAGNGIYGATKHAIIALSEALVKELEQANAKIKVSVLCPSFVNTTIMDCERNRPAEYRSPDYMPATEKMIKKYPDSKSTFDFIRRMFEAGLSPDKVGEIVFQAMRDDAFYILPNTDLMYKKNIKNRINKIINAFQQNKLYK
ncbi:MAG: SDR family NAD(P)-dependent oxidoreductase [Candidatus Thorarchaeota archaeon]